MKHRTCLIGMALLACASGLPRGTLHAQADAPVRAALSTVDGGAMLTLDIADGWRLLAVDDTATGQALRVEWHGADVRPLPAPRSRQVETVVGAARVYEGRVVLHAEGDIRRAVVRYAVCGEVCVVGRLDVRAGRD